MCRARIHPAVLLRKDIAREKHRVASQSNPTAEKKEAAENAEKETESNKPIHRALVLQPFSAAIGFAARFKKPALETRE
jgi:hypothetical protein